MSSSVFSSRTMSSMRSTVMAASVANCSSPMAKPSHAAVSSYMSHASVSMLLYLCKNTN
jgi:hypothetical protein